MDTHSRGSEGRKPEIEKNIEVENIFYKLVEIIFYEMEETWNRWETFSTIYSRLPGNMFYKMDETCNRYRPPGDTVTPHPAI